MNDIDQTALEIARAFVPVDVVGQQRANLQVAIIEAIKKHANPKTLADAQPGGRVRLGDQAERAQWRSMDTCPRDGTVVRLRWGEDHVSPGWWSAPVSPVQNDDGTWPSDTGGFPWAFIDFNNGSAFVNHAVDTEYGPTHWAPYVALSAQPSPGGQEMDGSDDR